ncbi:hypothetical protein [Bradyrhizobium yuanmingense]|uniref:hypothetical protein n=1 Tax=Bradyrhizobium yuanmingense TaxID=108015 RepID=UPI001CD47BFA|nr:hypothetical protein [Bradyrhizobium yuanmingense]MCA1524301.1 hypothetical protein [Bradyrhizobium yuanmingense]
MARKLRVKAVGDSKLSHPHAGRIRPEGSLWPADQFTMRRIREGVITVEKEEPAAKPKAKPPAAAPQA